MERDSLVKAVQKTYDKMYRYGFYEEVEYPVIKALDFLIHSLEEIEDEYYTEEPTVIIEEEP